MEIRCISSNREMLLKVLQREVQARAVFHPAPDFTCTVGGYSLCRDGWLRAEEDTQSVFPLLASLELCDYPYVPNTPEPGTIFYSIENHNGRSLLNLFSIISSRQLLLNRALAASKAFFVLPSLMERLLAHPPITANDFLQALYGRDEEYGGVCVDRTNIQLTGFRLCRQEEAYIHCQLAERMIHASLQFQWIKPFTRNVKNKKYAFRTWLNEIGMIGPEYEEARIVMLSRLYGKSDQRSMTR